MPTSWDAVNALCPFYQTENAYSISCEGIIANESSTHRFISQTDKKAHKQGYCNSCYKKCEYYISLMRMKYEE